MRSLLVMWMVLGAACGDRHPATQHDAGESPPDAVDAMADAMPDARDPTVRVHIESSAPGGSWDVVFYAPNNELIARVTAGADGLASAAMPDGGTVLVAPDPVTEDPDGLRALFGVKPGDDIRLVPFPRPRGTGTMTLTVPAEDGTAVYRAVARCAGGSGRTTTMTAFYDFGCQVPLPILVRTEDDSGNMISALRGTLSSLTSATITGDYLAPQTISLQITNGDRANSMSASVFPVLGQDTLNLSQDRFQSVVPGQSIALAMAVPPAATIDARAFDLSFGAGEGGRGGQSYHRVRPASESTFTFDASVEGLPWYGDRRYDPVLRKLTLPLAADPTIDGQTAEFIFERDPQLNLHWTLVIPPDATQIVMPPIPDPRYEPGTGPNVTMIRLTTTAIRASSYNGYEDLLRGVPVTYPVGSYYDVTVF